MNCDAQVAGPQSRGLEPARIHVWTAPLCEAGAGEERCRELLSDAQRARADRFATPLLRRRYVVAHALLRDLLSAHVGTPPAALRFGANPHGKPCLPENPEICFNLSHADDMAAIVIARQREVGIDIVATRSDVDCDGVARLAFSPAECAALGALEAGDRRQAFFRIWARKEAYVKARGAGLGYPTRAFSVGHATGNRDALLDDEHDPGAAGRWRVAEIPASDGFHCALAAQGRDWTVTQVDAKGWLPRP